MTAYVCGFVFDTEKRVCLIRKNRPDWQNGLLNGVGGKIKPDELAVLAMVREFEEEAGVLIPLDRWISFHKEAWANGASVEFFAAGLRPGEVPCTKTDERVVMFHWRNNAMQQWQLADCMYNLPYLVPMAYCWLYFKPQDFPFHRKL